MHVKNDVLESSTGKGAEMTGRAMLAAKKSCLNCIFAMFAGGRVEAGEVPECKQDDGRQHSSTASSLFVFVEAHSMTYHCK